MIKLLIEEQIPVIRDGALTEHPELEAVINKLAGKITDEEMQKLNGEVDQKQRTSIEVAKEWLKAEGLIK